MKNALILTGAMVASTLSAQAAATLISDDFSSGTFSSGIKFETAQVNSGWHKRSNNGPAWEISGGALTNPGLVANDEKPAFRLNSISSTDTSLTQIRVTFDYVVGAGSTLFFHSALFQGTLGTLDAGVSNSDGTWAADQYATGFSLGGMNLDAGQSLSSGDANSIFSVSGASGTYTETFNIASATYAGINSIADVSHIIAVFASNNSLGSPAGAISIDNLNITAIPEPSSTALLGLAGLALILRRRK